MGYKKISVEINGVFYKSINYASNTLKHTYRTIKSRCMSNNYPNYKIITPDPIKQKCTKCKKMKPWSEFYTNKNKKSGYCTECIKCCSEINKKNRKNNPKYYKKYGKEWRENNPEKVKRNQKEWGENNAEHVIEYRGRRDVKDKRNKRRNKRRKNDPAYKLTESIRNSIGASLKGIKGGRHWEGLVGWTVGECKVHLESLFTEGMSWDNYGHGKYEWNLDHIIAIYWWNITSIDCQALKDCWALKNLQPLWAVRNYEKGVRLMEPKYLIKPF